MTIRAKVKCQSVKKFRNYKGELNFDAEFNVVGNDDPGEENASFFAATPSGKINLSTVRDDLFEVGKAYYVDFTEVGD